jgi:hypothetical protein
MTKIYEAKASYKYKDAQGLEKTRYVRIGTLFVKENGSKSLKLDATPVGPEFTGYINFYEPNTDKQPSQRTQATSAMVDDEIPF